MIDITTNAPLRVRGDGSNIPSLLVPLKQLPEVRKLLEEHGIGYWVEENAISLGGRPPIAFVNFERCNEVKKIQEVLDSVA